MPKDYKPPRDAADTFARYKTHYEGERTLKPEMLEYADRELQAGATVGQLAKLTGLTPEVFRRRARTLGIEHKRPPTVGRLRDTPEPPAPPREPRQAPAPRQQASPQEKTPEPSVEGRPLTDEEAKTLAELAHSRATDIQRQKLKQIAANAAKGYQDYAIVSSALDMELLAHDEVYGEAPTA